MHTSITAVARNASSSPLHNRQKNEEKGALGEFVHARAYKRESCETHANQTVSSIYWICATYKMTYMRKW